MSGYSFFAKFYDILTENVSYRERAAYFDRLIKKYGGKEKGVLLDLACGTGSLSEELSALGYDVIGADNSPEMLGEALEKKINKGLSVQYVCQDMRELDLFGNPDIVVCALDSLNHLESAEDIGKAFRSVSVFLEAGALFIFDMNTPYKHKDILGNESFVYETDSVFCVWQNEFEGGNENKVNISLDFFEERDDGFYERSSEYISEIAPEISVIKKLLEDADFQLLALYDYDSEKPVTDKSEKFVCVSVKKGKN